ncbi:MAG: hypothetical protein H7293_07280 [Candidatus Saccharibacteria bacterium]|nr:hypothetical protein [Rhodoferax sp.]
MQESYFKARVPATLHAAASARAGREGLRLGSYLREAIERDLQLKAVPVVVAPPPVIDHETRIVLQEMRLILRELAMSANAQIMPKVAAQMKSQTQPSN